MCVFFLLSFLSLSHLLQVVDSASKVLMSSRAIQDNEVEALLKSLSFKSLDDRPQPGQYSGARILGSSQPLSMEQILSAMPRHKLSRTDFMNDELTKLKEKADHEASLPAERVALIRRAQLITTLDATYEMVNKSYRGQTPPTLQVLIDRPERYSSAKMKNLARSTYICAYRSFDITSFYLTS